MLNLSSTDDCFASSFRGFGTGNISDKVVPVIGKLIKQGKPVIIDTQCSAGAIDLTAYKVGRQALDAGALSGKDMTSTAIYMKLAIALGMYPKEQGKDVIYQSSLPRMDLISRFMRTNIAGEFSPQYIEKK